MALDLVDDENRARCRGQEYLRALQRTVASSAAATAAAAAVAVPMLENRHGSRRRGELWVSEGYNGAICKRKESKEAE